MLSNVRVPSDPAQIPVTNASFRVRFAQRPRPAAAEAAPLPIIPTSVRTAAHSRAPRGPGSGLGRPRVTPVMWSGRTDPDDTAATRLIPGPDLDDDTLRLRPVPSVVGPRRPDFDLPGRPLPADDPYDPYDPRDPYDSHNHSRSDNADFEEPVEEPHPPFEEGAGSRTTPVRHAWYPSRRRNPGVVLLPLRLFLGGSSIYAGMSKLCNPVYFDGGDRGSMVQWLSSLHPWGAGELVRDLALSHPVGAGLTVAFTQIIVGVLSVLGLWQRLAAAIGIVLSVTLLLTVSWRTVAAYNAPDIIYFAAWSPLLFAGAPSCSLDARLATEAWRRLGPRVPVLDLRRRVLRRGSVIATVVVGLTLLVGSVLGSAVRAGSLRTDLPGPSDDPTNNLPGSPLPQIPGVPGGGWYSGQPSQRPSSSPSGSTDPSDGSSRPASQQPTPGAGTGGNGQPTPGSGQGTPHQPQQPPPRHTRGPDPTPTGDDGGGALGGILGASSSGLLGMPRDSAHSSASA